MTGYAEYLSQEQESIKELLEELSRARQDYHANKMTSQRLYNAEGPHRSAWWKTCPASQCKQTLKVFQTYRLLVPSERNIHALRAWRRKRGRPVD